MRSISFESRIRERRNKVKGKYYKTYYLLIPSYIIKAEGIKPEDLRNKKVKVTVIIDNEEEKGGG